MKNHFDREAAAWDQDERKIHMAETIAAAMTRKLDLSPTQVLMDYGTGTGLIALKLRTRVREVIAVDNSRGMLEMLKAKLAKYAIPPQESPGFSPGRGLRD
ncbi:MAG: class I SAM-dependent methyltransferase [candidate division FCPU426 bacterium]